MPIRIRGQSDAYVDQIGTALADYEQQHPEAQIDLYRYERGYVRVRIIDPAFQGVDVLERDRQLWKFLDDRLPEDIVSEISFLILLAPAETANSLANLEFEDPSPTLL